MITYLLCSLMLSHLSSTFLLLLPDKTVCRVTGKGERDDGKKKKKNRKRQGPIQSPKEQMTKRRKNLVVINKFKTPNLEKQILYCLANIC